MTTDKTLYDVYIDYRNGNKKVLDDMFVISNQIDDDNKKYKCLRCVIPDINRMINCAYDDFQCEYINTRSYAGRYVKYVYGIYKGSKDDMTDVFVEVIRNIFDDVNICLTDNKTLYQKIKADVTRTLNDILKQEGSAFEIPVEYKSADGKVMNCLEDADLIEYINVSYGHTELMMYYLSIMKEYNISDMLSEGNEITRNVIKLFENPATFFCDERDDKLKVIPNADFVNLYNSTYSSEIAPERVPEAYNTIYELLMKCRYGYVPIDRKTFKKRNRNECKSKDNTYDSKTIVRKATPEETKKYLKQLQDKKSAKNDYLKLMERKFEREISA